jgi:hypothetical protein
MRDIRLKFQWENTLKAEIESLETEPYLVTCEDKFERIERRVSLLMDCVKELQDAIGELATKGTR